MEMEQFKQSLLKYLFVEKTFEDEDAEKQKMMSDEEKIENDLLLVGATVVSQDENIYELNVPDNYSKLRVGDKVILNDIHLASSFDATITDVFFDTITVMCDKQLDISSSFTIEQKSPQLINTLISCLEGIYSGIPGAAFLRLLSGEEPFEKEDFLKVNVDDVPNFDKIKELMNAEQLNAVSNMLEYPPVHVLQGPPGTGKTLVLAATAIATAHMNREVVVIANTHHAVNNALKKIKSIDKKSTVIKVGSLLKAEELDDTVIKFSTFKEYYEFSYKNRKKKRSGHIIGLTIWGALTYLGLRHHAHFRPYHALIDEASLMPLSLATILGKTAPSVCLFGDSRQMQPIFRSELEQNIMSKSILDYCAENIEGVTVDVLHTTYRMNNEITECVSKAFYEPYGIRLVSSEISSENRLEYHGNSESLQWINIETECEYLEENREEAECVSNIVKELLSIGLNHNDIAVVTPFRKQVSLIRSMTRNIVAEDDMPLIDTVERLQGQDVDCVIISFVKTSDSNVDFIFNPNRLNVMISRAKRKVFIITSNEVGESLKKLIDI
mgnify:FL=1